MKTTKLSVLVMLLACLSLNALNPPKTKKISETCIASTLEQNASASVNLNGFLFEFLGVVYNPDGTSTWTYKVTGIGARRNLSHWKLKLLDEHNVTSSSPNTWEVHVDRHFRYYGIKWDSSVRKNCDTKTFSFTLNGRYDVGAVNFGYKAGRRLFHGTIQGPKTPSVNTISGNIFNDENSDGVNAASEGGLSNVTVHLFEDVNANGRIDRDEPLIGTTVSDSTGNYQFSGITVTNVIVQLVLPANTAQFIYTPTTSVSAVLTTGVSTTVDFGINRQLAILYKISGLIWDDQNSDRLKDTTESTLEGVPVTLYEDVNANRILDTSDRLISTITTSVLGTYEFTNVTLNNVLIIPTLPASGTFTTLDSRAISSINTDIVDMDFGIKITTALFQVTGVVFDDQNENGIIDVGENSIEGLLVEIYVDTDASGDFNPNSDLLVAFTQTSNNGLGFLSPNYLVDDVPQGPIFIRLLIPDDTIFTNYTPTFDIDSGTVNPDGIYATIIMSNLTNINFGLKVTQVGARSTASNQDTMFTNDSAISVAPEDVSDKLVVYPNPTTHEIAICTEEFIGDINVEIYNERGYKTFTKTVSPFGNEFKVDVQRLAPGMYYAKFAARNKVASKKFIKK